MRCIVNVLRKSCVRTQHSKTVSSWAGRGEVGMGGGYSGIGIHPGLTPRFLHALP